MSRYGEYDEYLGYIGARSFECAICGEFDYPKNVVRHGADYVHQDCLAEYECYEFPDRAAIELIGQEELPPEHF